MRGISWGGGEMNGEEGGRPSRSDASDVIFGRENWPCNERIDVILHQNMNQYDFFFATREEMCIKPVSETRSRNH
jgi:hypothetical protein